MPPEKDKGSPPPPLLPHPPPANMAEFVGSATSDRTEVAPASRAIDAAAASSLSSSALAFVEITSAVSAISAAPVSVHPDADSTVRTGPFGSESDRNQVEDEQPHVMKKMPPLSSQRPFGIMTYAAPNDRPAEGERELSAEEVFKHSLDFDRSEFDRQLSEGRREVSGSFYPRIDPSLLLGVVLNEQQNDDDDDDDRRQHLPYHNSSSTTNVLPVGWNSPPLAYAPKQPPNTSLQDFSGGGFGGGGGGIEESKEEILTANVSEAADAYSSSYGEVSSESTSAASSKAASLSRHHQDKDESSSKKKKKKDRYKQRRDARLARAMGDEAKVLAALKRAVYSREASEKAGLFDDQATVVAIASQLNPSELGANDAVQAEFIGQDYTIHAGDAENDRDSREGAAMVEDGYVTAVDATAATEVVSAAAAYEDDYLASSAPLDDGLVISSTPLEGDYHEDGAVAQVLSDNDSIPWMDRKPSAMRPASPSVQEDVQVAAVSSLYDHDSIPSAYANHETISVELEVAPYTQAIHDTHVAAVAIEDDAGPSAFNDQEALVTLCEDLHPSSIESDVGVVVEIEEVAHPDEFEDHDAEAELVGTDLSSNLTAVAAVYDDDHDTGAEVDHPNYQTQQMQASAEEVLPVGAGSHSGLATATGNELDPVALTGSSIEVLPEASVVPESLAEEASPTEFIKPRPFEGYSPSAQVLESPSNEPPDWMESPSCSRQSLPSVTGQIDGGEESEGDIPQWLRSPPANQFGQEARNASTSAESDSTNTSQRNGMQSISNNIVRGTSNVMEALFGDTKPAFGGRRLRMTSDDAARSVRPRTLLPWSVIFSPPTKMWIATLQTNQRALDSNNVAEASKSLRAFSLPTEKQAVCLARAWTPPRMLSFSENNTCHTCSARFAVFRRPCHCRNCGVCICKPCAIQWPVKMIPDTYNIKKENSAHVCKSCDWLCTAFRLALLNGDLDKAIALHATGNVNLHTPFANVKGELFYPVHCAVIGGELEMLKWLVDENCCPIKSVRVSGTTRDSASKYTPIVTSKGRSLLGIAMENGDVSIVRYLVVQKGILLSGEKDITHDMLVRTLDAALRRIPASASSTAPEEETLATAQDFSLAWDDELPVPNGQSFQQEDRSLSDEARNFGAINRRRGEHAAQANHDECIVCFDNKIDCVATPCGHQIICLKCSEHISKCPVCSSPCSFMRVFKP